MEKIEVQIKIGNQTYTGTLTTTQHSEPVFPETYAKMLTVTDKDDHWRIQAKEYIHNKDDFKNIADIVREYGGEYVSQGKDSHFRIPK